MRQLYGVLRAASTVLGQVGGGALPPQLRAELPSIVLRYSLAAQARDAGQQVSRAALPGAKAPGPGMQPVYDLLHQDAHLLLPLLVATTLGLAEAGSESRLEALGMAVALLKELFEDSRLRIRILDVQQDVMALLDAMRKAGDHAGDSIRQQHLSQLMMTAQHILGAHAKSCSL